MSISHLMRCLSNMCQIYWLQAYGERAQLRIWSKEEHNVHFEENSDCNSMISAVSKLSSWTTFAPIHTQISWSHNNPYSYYLNSKMDLIPKMGKYYICIKSRLKHITANGSPREWRRHHTAVVNANSQKWLAVKKWEKKLFYNFSFWSPPWAGATRNCQKGFPSRI